ncbi:signal transduction histidine kinase [Kitasatospora sp. MAP12-15]|uniref:sensor histidine kinase n=1 Tax=unclassified Kitasatospora TaxID=2633591 RepID=UPI0024751859|nr:histidine kinase [Kitasatospora sp. MAP12-44]MDH6113118.1 signal transduction histidine kinase [Kitasatospora sp. MAP12-44]
MSLESWVRWPPSSIDAARRSRPRTVLNWAGRVALLTTVVSGTYATGRFTGWSAVLMALQLLVTTALFVLMSRACRARRLGWALVVVVGLLLLGILAHDRGALLLANVAWCGVAVNALLRLPLAAALPACAAALGSYAVAGGNGYLAMLATVGGLALLGYLLRLDAEARGAAQRLVEQQLAARAAEAETAALAERARIAREIHDVLAHSLSAQLVHLEAARLMLDRGAERAQIRERVVAARRMAQDGLVETRQALSALRGEFTPVGEFLVQLAHEERAVLTVHGTPRPLAAEAGLAVRRTAQEALTNVRKHAPGGACSVQLSYLADEVELEIRNVRAPQAKVSAELAGSGSGYGLLGMRERAELLGGSLLAGPDNGGWRVLLRVPA